MLIQFRFKNYKSFRDEAILDLSSTKITENAENVVQVGKEKILKMAAIYGANASGKSGIFDAFEYMSYYVIQSFTFDDEISEKQRENRIAPTPFKFSKETKDSPSEFEVYFSKVDAKGKIKFYNYGFAVDANRVHEEWLNVKSVSAKEYKNIFYRNMDRIEFSDFNSKQEALILEGLSKETLILSLGAKLNIGVFREVRRWFLDNETLNYASLTQNVYLYRNMPDEFDSNAQVREDVIRYFSSFDDGIVGFEVEENQQTDEKEDPTYTIDTLHKMMDSNEQGKIPLGDESAGTLKMFSLYPFLMSIIKNGNVLFVDELNARLHPLLVRNIILLFANKETNPNNAQLIFTTHDTWQLSTNLLRRDEVWFTEKDQYGCSSLYALSDFKDSNGFKIRKDENYEKNYLLGNYGAIPRLTQLKLKGDK